MTYPAPVGTHGASHQLTLMKIFDDLANSGFGFVDEVPLIRVDYREFVVNTVHNRAFSHIYLPVGVDWIDDLLVREGFARSFKDNMRRMLDTGEYFAYLGVRDGRIFIDRLPRDWVTRCAFYEKTGELLLLVYVEPVVLLDRIHKISWKRVTWTPETKKTEISLEDDPTEEEAYTVQSIEFNPYGFVPVVPFKIGTHDRGKPIWKDAEGIINQIQDIVNDIRLINAYHAAPLRYIKTDGEIHGIGEDGLLQLGPEDDIGALTYSIGDGLFKELDYAIATLSDILNVPVTSILQVGRHASGEAIEKRIASLTRMCKGLREHVGEQMKLMFRMMGAFISKGLVEVDVSDPQIASLLTDQVIVSGDTWEIIERKKAVFASNLGRPMDLTAFINVPDVKWVPIEKIIPQDFLQLMQGFQLALETGLITPAEARKMLELNIDQLLIANDLQFMDEAESEAARLGERLKEPSQPADSDTRPRVGMTTLQ